MRALRLKTVVTLLLTFAVSSAYGLTKDPPSYKPWIIKATCPSLLVSSLERINMLFSLMRQHDTAAFNNAVIEGLAAGEADVAMTGVEVYFMKRINNIIIQVRPVGQTQLYYTLSSTFDEGRSAKEESEK